MSVWELWLLMVVLPGLDSAAFPIVVVCTIGTVPVVVGGIVWKSIADAEDDESQKAIAEKVLGLWKVTVTGAVLFTAIGIAVPDREQIMYIVGGSVVTNAEGIEELPDNLVQYANRFLEQTEKDQETSGGQE